MKNIKYQKVTSATCLRLTSKRVNMFVLLVGTVHRLFSKSFQPIHTRVFFVNWKWMFYVLNEFLFILGCKQGLFTAKSRNCTNCDIIFTFSLVSLKVQSTNCLIWQSIFYCIYCFHLYILTPIFVAQCFHAMYLP